MRRKQLFEFEDFSWFPRVIRDGGTDFIGFMLQHTAFYHPAVSVLEELLKKTHHRQILDLCSGNGGPIIYIQQHLQRLPDIHYILSDKYPNQAAFQALKHQPHEQIDFSIDALDVLALNTRLKGIRTIFSAIHHFRPEEVRMILHNIVQSGHPIGIFDGGARKCWLILTILLVHPLMFLLCTPFIRPFKWNRLIFTYLLPLIPLYTIWDGVVSIMRLYHSDELRALAEDVDTEGYYEWQHGTLNNKLGLPMAFLTGYKK